MAQLSGRRVLVVEDEALLAMTLEDILTDAGAEVLGPALDLQTAIDLARSSIVDAAVLDVNLAGERSFPVAAILSDRSIPYLFATGYGASVQAEGYAGAPVLQKPYQPVRLVELIAELLP